MRLHPAAWSLFLLLATGLVAAGFYATQPRSDETPELSVPTTGNETFSLGGARGSVVVLDFFQIWCESCIIVENSIRERVDAWNASGVEVVSVGVAPANTLDDLRRYQTEHNITWTVASDTDRAVEKFGVVALPTLAVLDADGRIVFRKAGVVAGDELDSVVAQAQAQERAPVAFARFSLWGLAVVAAVASFFSPCAIGLLPGYVAHTVRAPDTPSVMGRAAKLGALAALGLLLVFLGIGGLALAFGQWLTPYVTWLAPVVGFVFIGVGLLLLVRPYSLWLQRVFGPLTSLPAQDTQDRTALTHFLYGIGYGAGAAGCTAPVLLNLVVLAATQSAATGLAMIAVYAVSAALLMAVLTMVVAGSRAGVATWIRRHAHKVEVASALLFVGAGVFLLWYAWRAGTLT